MIAHKNQADSDISVDSSACADDVLAIEMQTDEMQKNEMQTERSGWILRFRPMTPKAFGLGTLAVLGLLVGLNLASPVLQDWATPDYRYELTAFAVPAKPVNQRPWGVEVNQFASKVTRAFGVRATTAQEFSGWILEASERHDFEPELIASLVLTESSFRKQVRSHVGALGPAQVRPEMWGRFCGASDLTDPAENIYCGAQVLAHLRDICGDNTCALKAYNVGRYSKQHEAANRYFAKVDKHLNTIEAL